MYFYKNLTGTNTDKNKYSSNFKDNSIPEAEFVKPLSNFNQIPEFIYL